MRTTKRRALPLATLISALGLASFQQAASAQSVEHKPAQSQSRSAQAAFTQHRLPNAELTYLKTLHDNATEVDPTLIGMLIGLFISAKQAEQGAAFFARIAEKASDDLAVRYRTAGAVLRAVHTNDLFIFKRRSWVKDTIAIFDESRDALPDSLQIRWLIGTTLAQLPGLFGQQEAAKNDLEWLMERLDQIPGDGLISGTEREVFYQLACLYQKDGNKAKASHLLKLSGYKSFERDATINSQFAASAERGLTLSMPVVNEEIAGKVFTASGFEMTEYNFIVSEDGSQTIAIDAGTRPESAARAHQAVLARFPNLPPVSTVLVTHTHWDHVGGHQYFRDQNTNVEFISRDNYAAELDIIRNSQPAFQYFFSKHYSNENVANYLPDRTISGDTMLTIGGTEVRAIPIPGGETHDGLFFHFPQHRITFVGDFIMPYVGAPFANEGDPEGLLEAIDILATLDSDRQLHGHKPLTDLYAGIAELQKLRAGLQWLIVEFKVLRQQGLSSEDIRQRNLIPDVVFNEPKIQLPYLALRSGFLSRLYVQSIGYWEANLDGMDYLNHRDMGNVLSEYVGISEHKFDKALKRLLSEGENDAALKLTTWAQYSYPDSDRIKQHRVTALRGLRAKYQFANPFKFLIYTESLGEPVPQLSGEWRTDAVNGVTR